MADKVTIGGYDGDGAALQSLVACDTPFVVTATQSTQAMGVLGGELGHCGGKWRLGASAPDPECCADDLRGRREIR